MTLSYLSLPGTKVLNVNGTATVTLRPDVGQYWLPTLVHVGTRSGNPIFCGLHSGGLSALTDASTLKDFTPQGNNDSSSILSGTVISYGEGILCEFSGGIVGDIVTVEVIGLSSSEPPTLGIIPTVPGVRFAGGIIVPANPYVTLLDFNNLVSVSFSQSNLIVTQAFAHIMVRLSLTSTPATGAFVIIDWYQTPSGTFITATDTISVQAGQTFQQTFPVKGNYANVALTVTNPPSTVTLRIFGQTTHGEGAKGDNKVVLNSLNGITFPAGSSGAIQLPDTHYGPAHSFVQSTAAAWTVTYEALSSGNPTRLLWRHTNASPQAPCLVMLPPRGLQYTVLNSDAVTQTFWISLVPWINAS